MKLKSIQPPLPNQLDWGSQEWRGHPQAQGLYAWWPTRDTDNRLYNPVDGQYATPHGDVCSQSDGQMGWSSYSFHGNPSNYWVAPFLWNLNRSVTVSAWMNFPKANDYSSLFSIYYGGAYTPRFQLSMPNPGDDYLTFDYGALGTEDYRIVCDASPYFNKWVHVVLQASTYLRRIYVNGELQASLIVNNPTIIDSPKSELTIGNYRTGEDLPFAGRFTDFRIYNRVLSESEIWQLYNPATRWDMLPVKSNRMYFFNDSPAAPVFRRNYYQRYILGRRTA